MPRLLLFALALGGPCYASAVVMPFTALPTTLTNGNSAATIGGFAPRELIYDDGAADSEMPALEGGEIIINTSGATLDGVANNGTLLLTETQVYETAAILRATLAAAESNPSENSATDYQYALWYLFHNTGADQLALSNNQLTDLFDAAGIVTSASQTEVHMPKVDAAMLAVSTTAPVIFNPEPPGFEIPAGAPEPGTWILMVGIGFLFLIPGVRSKVITAISRR
ncbi:MAG: hypothetical protein WBY44_29700 [Bryobacteraceae bacterium]